jgi:hypothetical protein
MEMPVEFRFVVPDAHAGAAVDLIMGLDGVIGDLEADHVPEEGQEGQPAGDGNNQTMPEVSDEQR